MPPLRVTPAAARRFQRHAVGLDQPFPDVAAALGHLGYIQIDPINICGRMHDLILRNRVANYQEGDLHRSIHGSPRNGFEHYLPHLGLLVAFPLDAWPYLSGLIASRRLRRGVFRRNLSPKAERIAQYILKQIEERGPLTSDDIEHKGASISAWGTPGRLVKHLLEIMFVHGRVLITERRGFRRVYDLPERVLPLEVRALTPKTIPEVERWTILLRLRQRRLAMLTRAERALVADTIQEIAIDGCPPLFCLRDDVAQLHESATSPQGEPPAPPTLLAPLDPLIYDRRLTANLWNFAYTWEAYTPAAKRVRGYYAMPILAGEEIVGYVDSKADRLNRRLVVISRRVRRGHSIAETTRNFAKWLGLRRR